MSTVVCKFGGTSVSDAGMFVRVNRIIRSDPGRKYIVLSAPGKRRADDEKITDLFYRAHDGSRRGDYSILSQIFSRYANIRDALAPEFNLEREFMEIRSRLHTSPDYAASRGEYLCARLFAAYTGAPFVDAAQLLFFDANGEIDSVRSVDAVTRLLAPLPHAVIPGFYGTGADGEIKTFSRGGSDVSGALLSAMLGADLYENWTDVEGLYTADPRIVPGVRRNSIVSLRQMEQIARAGAQLLHPDALKPLEGTGIDTLLKNTFSPGADGTRISESCTDTVFCVTGKRPLYLIGDAECRQMLDCNLLLHSLPVHGSIPVAAIRVFGMNDAQLQLAERQLKPIHIIHMQDHIQIIIPEQEYETGVRAVHAILLEQDPCRSSPVAIAEKQ